MKLKNTNKRLTKVGKIIVKGLRSELANQKHNASGNLSRSIKAIKTNAGKNQILNVISTNNKKYWQVVNNPSKWSFNASKSDIIRWAAKKGIPKAAYAIYNKLMGSKKTNRRGFYGRPYVYWTEGNNLRRTDFAGYTARKFKSKVAEQLAPAIGKDVADMIRKELRKIKPTA